MELNSDTIMVEIYPEDGGSMFFGNFGFRLSNYMVSHPIRK
jgi:hypothetical protein